MMDVNDIYCGSTTYNQIINQSIEHRQYSQLSTILKFVSSSSMIYYIYKNTKRINETIFNVFITEIKLREVNRYLLDSQF